MRIYGSEGVLWKAFLSGDKEAFSALYRIYSDVLFSYGYRMVGDRDMVKDAIQDLFVKLYNNRLQLNETDYVKFYLLKALRNALISKLEQQRNVSLDADESLFTQLELTMDEEEEEESFSELQKKELTRAMETLTARQREAVYLRYISNVPLEEIAQMLDMNYQSTRNLIHRSLLKLRKELLPLVIMLFSSLK